MTRPMEGEDMNENAFEGFVEAWREDPAWRARVEADPKAALAEKGVDMSGVDEVRIAVDTAETVHVVFPAPEAPLPDGALKRVVGGVNGRQLYGVWDDDGRFLGYSHGGRPF